MASADLTQTLALTGHGVTPCGTTDILSAPHSIMRAPPESKVSQAESVVEAPSDEIDVMVEEILTSDQVFDVSSLDGIDLSRLENRLRDVAKTVTGQVRQRVLFFLDHVVFPELRRRAYEDLLLLIAIAQLALDKRYGGIQVALIAGDLDIPDKEMLIVLVATRFDQILESWPVLSANDLHELQDALARGVEMDLRRILEGRLGFDSDLNNIMGSLEHQQGYGLMRQVLIERLVRNDQPAARNASQELSRLLKHALSIATQLVVEPSADLARTVSELLEKANAVATVTGFTWDQATEKKWLNDLETVPLEVLRTTPSVEVEAGEGDFAWHKATVVAIVEGALTSSLKKVSSLYFESWLVNTIVIWLPKKLAGAILTTPLAVAVSVSGSSATSDLEGSLMRILETGFRELNDRLEERLDGELTVQVRAQIHEALRQAVWAGYRARQKAEGRGVPGARAPAWLDVRAAIDPDVAAWSIYQLETPDVFSSPLEDLEE